MEIRTVDEDIDSEKYPIRPEDIDADQHFYMAFGQAEVEMAAQYVVRFCQKLGGWKAFTKEELNQFYIEIGGPRNLTLHSFSFGLKPTFPFYWLSELLLAQRPGNDKYCVTDLFIERCFASSPKKK